MTVGEMQDRLGIPVVASGENLSELVGNLRGVLPNYSSNKSECVPVPEARRIRFSSIILIDEQPVWFYVAFSIAVQFPFERMVFVCWWHLLLPSQQIKDSYQL
jgi:hypothetical protein